MLQGLPSYIITSVKTSFSVTIVTPSDDTFVLPAELTAITVK